MRNQNQIVKNLTLAETIAHRSPEIANEMLIKNGYPASRTRDELTKMLNSFILKHQDKALTELASIHPDRDLLFSNFDSDFIKTGNKSGPVNVNKQKGAGTHHNCCGHADGEYSNCSGCGGSCQNRPSMHFNADGAGQVKSPSLQPQSLFNKEMLAIVGVIALTGIILIAFNKKS